MTAEIWRSRTLFGWRSHEDKQLERRKVDGGRPRSAQPENQRMEMLSGRGSVELKRG